MFSFQNSISTHCEILGVKATATITEIKAAYKKLALMYHPDKHIHESAEKQKEISLKFLEIKQAYDKLLSDVTKREEVKTPADVKENFIIVNSEKKSVNAYEVLGLSKNATKKEVRHQYLTMMRKYHPENGKTPDAKLFQKSNMAYKKIMAGLESQQSGSYSEPKQSSYTETKEPFTKSSFFPPMSNPFDNFFRTESFDAKMKNYAKKIEENTKNSKNKLISAIMQGKNIAEIKDMLESQKELVHAIDEDGNNLIHIGCIAKRPDVIRLAHSKGVDVNAKNKIGIPPLHLNLLLSSSSIDCLDCLMELNANIMESVSYRF